jgi:prepilin-type N-terminal cleavage/methylation domain-containing protein
MKSAFTLVEILVVIAIIAVLIAMLTPALEKAVYQAELTGCAARLKAIASTAMIYAADQRRHYPHRSGVHSTSGDVSWWPDQIRDPREGVHDDREEIQAYVDYNKVLNDPLTGTVDFTRDGSNGGTFILSSYELYYGWKYAASRGMIRLGDQWETTARPATPRLIYSMSIIAADKEYASFFHNNAWAGHPDKADILGQIVYQNFGDPGRAGQNSDTGTGAGSAAVEALVPALGVQQYGYAGASATFSQWDTRYARTIEGEVDDQTSGQNTKQWGRGPLDRNFAYADGAVLRINDIILRLNTPDPRMLFTSQNATTLSGGVNLKHLPKP